MKYCPNANCRHREASGSQAEYLDHVAVCADCGAALVAEAGSWVALTPRAAVHDEAKASEPDEDLRDRQARKDVRAGMFAISAGMFITLVTIVVPTERGEVLLAWGPIAYGAYRLVRGLDRKAS